VTPNDRPSAFNWRRMSTAGAQSRSELDIIASGEDWESRTRHSRLLGAGDEGAPQSQWTKRRNPRDGRNLRRGLTVVGRSIITRYVVGIFGTLWILQYTFITYVLYVYGTERSRNAKRRVTVDSSAHILAPDGFAFSRPWDRETETLGSRNGKGGRPGRGGANSSAVASTTRGAPEATFGRATTTAEPYRRQTRRRGTDRRACLRRSG